VICQGSSAWKWRLYGSQSDFGSKSRSSSLTKGSVGDERVTVTTKDLAGGLMENQAKRFSVQHKQCALTVFAALLVGGRANEAAKNPQVAATALTTPGPR
jgi:uncharacterized membrane protein